MIKKHSNLVPDDDPGWVRFWECFPKRLAKLDARKAFAQMHPTTAELDAIEVALAWQVPLWAQQGYGIPYPASYLRGRRWEDEEPQPQKGQSMPRQAQQMPDYTTWECPHLETHASRWRCEQATALNQPRKVMP